MNSVMNAKNVAGIGVLSVDKEEGEKLIAALSRGDKKFLTEFLKKRRAGAAAGAGEGVGDDCPCPSCSTTIEVDHRFNVRRIDECNTCIDIELAGCAEGGVEVSNFDNHMEVVVTVPGDVQGKFVHQGFPVGSTKMTLPKPSSDFDVTGAVLKHGLLTITMTREIEAGTAIPVTSGYVEAHVDAE